MQTTTIVAIMLKIWMVHSRNVIGRRSSIISISLEKRFIILPIGVVSKKDIGDRSMLSSIRLWSLAEAVTILVRAKYPNINIAKPEIKKKKLIWRQQTPCIQILYSWTIQGRKREKVTEFATYQRRCNIMIVCVRWAKDVVRSCTDIQYCQIDSMAFRLYILTLKWFRLTAALSLVKSCAKYRNALNTALCFYLVSFALTERLFRKFFQADYSIREGLQKQLCISYQILFLYRVSYIRIWRQLAKENLSVLE